MVVNVKPEQLDGEIQKQLETYSAEVTKELNKNLKEVAEETAKILKKGGSYKERTGKYTPDWSVTAKKPCLLQKANNIPSTIESTIN